MINRNEQCELDALIKDEPCRKQIACDLLGIQDEYFDDKPFIQKTVPEIKGIPDYIIQCRQDLIKLGFIKG